VKATNEPVNEQIPLSWVLLDSCSPLDRRALDSLLHAISRYRYRLHNTNFLTENSQLIITVIAGSRPLPYRAGNFPLDLARTWRGHASFCQREKERGRERERERERQRERERERERLHERRYKMSICTRRGVEEGTCRSPNLRRANFRASKTSRSFRCVEIITQFETVKRPLFT